MKLGMHAGYVGSGVTSADQLGMVLAAEEYGFDSVWTAEAYGPDAATPLAWFAGQTKTIKLGSAILQIPGRTPANCAMVASSLDNISGGRFILGLGTSGPQVAEGWHGQPFAHQLQRTREYVEILRKLLARERSEYDGEIYKLPRPGGPGKPLKLIGGPVQQGIPIYLAAIGPNNTELCGEIADGWLPYLFSPAHLASLTKPLRAGAERVGRDLGEIAITPTVFTAIGDDVAALRDRMRPLIALYVGGMGSREKNFYNRVVSSYGFEAEARTIQDLYLERRYDEAMAAIPPEMIDLTTMVGDRAIVADRMAAYRDAGVDTLIITPMAPAHDERLAILRTLTELI